MAYEEIDIGLGHASILFDLLSRLEATSKISLKDSTHIALTRGPGSFTGIRVGLSFAKGLSLAGHLPILGLTCFEVAMHKLNGQSIGIAFDTKRNDFYGAFYKENACLDVGVWSQETVLEKQKQWGIDSLWIDKPEQFSRAYSLKLTAQDVASAAAFYLDHNPSVFSKDPFYLRPPKVYE